MQRRHSVRQLLWRGIIAGIAQGMMFTGLYPLAPHAYRAWKQRGSKDRGKFGRAALPEWGMSAGLSAVRAAGFWKLPGATGHGPRPIILLHGYAMNRANFLVLAHRLAKAGLGPIYGFEYWTLGRTAAAARKLGWFVDEVLAATGATTVDLVGHSMGGVVARYYVALAGGDPRVAHLVTIGSPHAGTDVSSIGIGHATRELLTGSALVTRLAAAPPPRHTKLTVIGSRADALVPAHMQPEVPGADAIRFDDLGHVSLLGSRRVATAIIERLRE